jgi:hypothetical protein
LLLNVWFRIIRDDDAERKRAPSLRDLSVDIAFGSTPGFEGGCTQS